MPSQQLLLSWKDHNGALVSIFESLLKKNKLVDCTLAAEGQYLKAHKVVLSACSSYFELLFSQESEKNPIVILKDVKFQELEAAVNFMYRGEVEVCENRLADFLEVADSLQIKGLGRDGKTQSSKEKPSASSSSDNLPGTPQQQSRKDVLSSHSDSAGQSAIIPADCELVRKNNESSLVHQSSKSESSRSSPSLPLSTSFCPSGQDTQSDHDNHENIQRISTALPHLPSGENEQSDINSFIKAEPITDAYEEEKSEEVDRDFGDEVTMMEDQEDWHEHNVETMNHKHSTNQQDLGANWIQQEDDQNFSSIFVKDEPGTSTSWNHQEPFGGSEIRSSAETSAAPTGPEYVLPDVLYIQQSARRSSTQIYHNARTTASPSIIYGVSSDSVNSSLQLQEHQETQPVEHKCPYCGFKAVTSTTLITHLRSHADERPYKCPYCTYQTRRNSDVTKHIRTHTGEKPYQCPECDYKSIELANLVRHRRKHTGEKPYKCPLCDFRANQSGSIHRHKRSIHSKGKGVKKRNS